MFQWGGVVFQIGGFIFKVGGCPMGGISFGGGFRNVGVPPMPPTMGNPAMTYPYNLWNFPKSLVHMFSVGMEQFV